MPYPNALIQSSPRNNLLATQMLPATGEGSYLRQQFPQVYGFLGGLAGTAPDEMQGSALDPNTAAVRQGASYGYLPGLVAGSVPLGKVGAGMGMLAGMARGTGKAEEALAAVKGAKQFDNTALTGAKFVAPQDEALRLAQQRATLPTSQGGLGLPVGNTPEQRAAAMGFDVEAYHGTASKDIQKFMPEGGTPEGEKTLEWYKNRQAQNQPVGYMSFRSGSFFSPKPDYAGHYAPENTGVMYPVNLRMDNPLSLLPNAQGRYAATNAPDINKTIDAMILQDSIDKSINEIAIIDPAQIRSRFAAFDPFRKTAAIAATMGVAAPDLLAGQAQQAPQFNNSALMK